MPKAGRLPHVARDAKDGLKYAGMAFMTFGEKLHSELSRKAEALSMQACAVKGLRRPRATWFRAEIRVRVRHLRNGSGLRTPASGQSWTELFCCRKEQVHPLPSYGEAAFCVQSCG
jgi:hypothetical protein